MPLFVASWVPWDVGLSIRVVVRRLSKDDWLLISLSVYHHDIRRLTLIQQCRVEAMGKAELRYNLIEPRQENIIRYYPRDKLAPVKEAAWICTRIESAVDLERKYFSLCILGQCVLLRTEGWFFLSFRSSRLFCPSELLDCLLCSSWPKALLTSHRCFQSHIDGGHQMISMNIFPFLSQSKWPSDQLAAGLYLLVPQPT